MYIHAFVTDKSVNTIFSFERHSDYVKFDISFFFSTRFVNIWRKSRDIYNELQNDMKRDIEITYVYLTWGN